MKQFNASAKRHHKCRALERSDLSGDSSCCSLGGISQFSQVRQSYSNGTTTKRVPPPLVVASAVSPCTRSRTTRRWTRCSGVRYCCRRGSTPSPQWTAPKHAPPLLLGGGRFLSFFKVFFFLFQRLDPRWGGGGVLVGRPPRRGLGQVGTHAGWGVPIWFIFGAKR